MSLMKYEDAVKLRFLTQRLENLHFKASLNNWTIRALRAHLPFLL